MSMKTSSDTNGNRTRDLRAFSALPQPTAPPRAPRAVRILAAQNLYRKLLGYSLIDGRLSSHFAFHRSGPIGSKM